jgi:hypothetical protein
VDLVLNKPVSYKRGLGYLEMFGSLLAAFYVFKFFLCGLKRFLDSICKCLNSTASSPKIN